MSLLVVKFWILLLSCKLPSESDVAHDRLLRSSDLADQILDFRDIAFSGIFEPLI